MSLLREDYSEKQEPKKKKEVVHEKTKPTSITEREVYNALREFKPYKVENEKDLEKQLVVHLRSKVSSEVTPQKAGAWHGNIYTPDIVVENIAVEVKFFNKSKRKDEWDRAIGQIIRYRIEGGYDSVILFIVDESGIVPEYYKEYEKILPWLKVIVRK